MENKQKKHNKEPKKGVIEFRKTCVTINSCQKIEHLKPAEKMVENYNKMFPDIDIYAHMHRLLDKKRNQLYMNT
jgi:hypothetical protein